MRVTVIGLGPGAGADLTGRAVEALERCDLIVGYTAYIALLEGQFPDKERRSTGMRREVDRCRMAVEEAAAGRDVALVCSGDSRSRWSPASPPPVGEPPYWARP